MKIPAFEPLEGWAWVLLWVAIKDEDEDEDDVEEDGLAADTAGTWARRMMSVRVPARSWRLRCLLRIRVIALYELGTLREVDRRTRESWEYSLPWVQLKAPQSANTHTRCHLKLALLTSKPRASLELASYKVNATV
jgi:hypothetical protein